MSTQTPDQPDQPDEYRDPEFERDPVRDPENDDPDQVNQPDPDRDPDEE